jgi:CDP-diacylglycerol pyrophosphatase
MAYTRRLMKPFIFLPWIVLALPALAEGVFDRAGFADSKREALWAVVRTCVFNHSVTGFSFPCVEVSTADGDSRGYVILRSLAIRDIVLAPAKRVVGLEDPWLRSADAPDYFGDAWNARHYVKDLSPRPVGDVDIALAVNSRLSRTQDQLHIHIGCVSSRARQLIESAAPGLSASSWLRVKKEALGVETYAREIESLDGVNLLRLAMDGIPSAVRNLGSMGIAVAASPLRGGRHGFVALAWFDETNAPGHPFAVEELLDPRCSNTIFKTN